MRELWTCPVCGEQNQSQDQIKCKRCGFDVSRSEEQNVQSYYADAQKRMKNIIQD